MIKNSTTKKSEQAKRGFYFKSRSEEFDLPELNDKGMECLDKMLKHKLYMRILGYAFALLVLIIAVFSNIGFEWASILKIIRWML